MKTGKVRGRISGIAKGTAMPTNTSTSAIMQMDEDGRVKIMIGAIDMGQS